MTSAVTRKHPAHSGLARRRVCRGGPCASSVRGTGAKAFTLIEVTLVMLLLALLVGAVVLNFTDWGESRRLEEGARRFEALLYMARAEAANRGRKLRLAFEPGEQDRAEIRILEEADPLGAPSEFSEFTACTWRHYLPGELVEVVRSELLGDSAYRLMERELTDQADSTDQPLEAVTFYPDGSCDSALIELASTGESDARKAIIEIEGLTGTITRRILTPSEWEQYARE